MWDEISSRGFSLSRAFMALFGVWLVTSVPSHFASPHCRAASHWDGVWDPISWGFGGGD